jgi:5-deoxy-glucuronate isomerase
LVGETWNPPGNWSSAPPHKHDADKPGKEAWLEEVYFYMTDKPQGFGIQRVYSGDDSPSKGDDVYLIRSGDTVVLPYGYHPVVAGPGYRLMYVWVLAGEKREYGAWSLDPSHAWLMDT